MSTPDQLAGSTARAGTREWIGLAVLVLPCMLVAMDMSVLFMALPFLSSDLEPSSSELLWIMDAYGFLLAGLLVTMGTVGDRVGRRRLLLLGAVGFGVASILAAYATSPATLIASRALLGVAGATLAPSTLSLIRNMFHDPGQRSAAIGIWTAGFAGGGVLGPIIGGALLEHFWWGSVFLVNVPVMLLLLALGPLLLPEFRDPRPGRFDFPGAALSLVAVVGFVYGIKKIAESGFSWTHLAVSLAGAAVGAVFLQRQRVIEHPMLDVALFRSRAFSVSLATNWLVMLGLVGFGLFSSQFLQLVLGMGPLESALWSLPGFVVMPVGVALGTTLAPRIGKPNVIALGLAVAGVGYLMLCRIQADASVWHLLVPNAVTAFGVGAVFALVTDLILAAAPPERAGSASALSETAAEFGGALGIAVLGSVGTAIYRGSLQDNAPPGLSPGQIRDAQDTLGGAVETAAVVPPATGRMLRDAAFEAFAREMRVIALVAAVLMALTAVLVGTLLRSGRGAEPTKSEAAASLDPQVASSPTA
ncbi:MFS transporter [Streptomyces sp. SID3343]|uniref:MFS transporter n=1 Tax=Streptomyces sp. SID3343 TaxID=2690260 RepID=UPI00136903FC|nr:MFS transporter [Streptomyces sp. SID3343]MYW05693.1 MFS transporter [Streptomyces sp. SID3343]